MVITVPKQLYSPCGCLHLVEKWADSSILLLHQGEPLRHISAWICTKNITTW